MQVRSGAERAGVAEQRHCFASRNEVALVFEQGGTVLVNGNPFSAVLDQQGVSRFNGVRTEHHGAVFDRLDGRTLGTHKVDPQVPQPQVQIVGNRTH